jgi:hypothetical protein
MSPNVSVVSWGLVIALYTQLSFHWYLCAHTQRLPFVRASFTTQQEFISCSSPCACVSLALRFSHPEGGYLTG